MYVYMCVWGGRRDKGHKKNYITLNSDKRTNFEDRVGTAVNQLL